MVDNIFSLRASEIIVNSLTSGGQGFDVLEAGAEVKEIIRKAARLVMNGVRAGRALNPSGRHSFAGAVGTE